MSEFTTICTLSELPENASKTVAVGARLVAVFNDRGTLCAIDDVCPHMGASLGAGPLEDGIVHLPMARLAVPRSRRTWADNPRIKIVSYPVRVVGDEVQVQVG